MRQMYRYPPDPAIGGWIFRWALIAAINISTSILEGSSAKAEVGDKLDHRSLSLSFSEEFDGPLSHCADRCRGERWRTKYFHSGDTPMSRGLGISSSSEIAVDSDYLGLGINPFEIADGILKIKVRPATEHTKMVVRDAWPAWYKGEHIAPRFTSGVLTTERSFSQKFGYFEARVKVPPLIGGWPAFWLLDTSRGKYDEIDIFEILTGQPNVHHFGHQWGRINVDAKTPERGEKNCVDLSSDFHTYGVLWTETSVVYYRDDLEVGRFKNRGLSDPMYVVLSIGMDGTWNEQLKISSSPDAAGDMLVDFIRVYRLQGPHN
ncbi:hypothetical protein ACVWWK_008064 [Bradyrhizobium sp. LB9.1b]